MSQLKIILAIVGSRTFTNFEEFGIRFYEALYGWNLQLREITTIISGGATGADTLAENFARSEGIPFEKYPADWVRYGKAAGPIRNREIIIKATHVLAFPSRVKSPGTLNAIKLATTAKKHLVIVWV